MDIGTISTRYAKALLAFAKDEKTENEVYQEMNCLAKSFSENPELKSFLVNPIILAEEKVKLLITASGINVTPTTERFIRFVIGKRKESYMHFICLSYQSLYHKSKKIVLAEIVSAEKMEKEPLLKIVEMIEESYKGNTIQLDVKVNPELIGGFVLSIGNTKLDASVLGELKSMKKELKQLNLYY